VERVTGKRRWHLVAATAVGAAAVSTWLVVGRLAERGGTDYILRVPQMYRPAEVVLGAAAASVVIGAAAYCWRNHRDSLVGEGWWRVYGRLLGVCVIGALGVRIVTAASVGANIGGGMILLGYPIPLLYVVGHAVAELRALRGDGVWVLQRFRSFDWWLLGGMLVVAVTMAADW
jgi:hypothetical protein